MASRITVWLALSCLMLAFLACSEELDSGRDATQLEPVAAAAETETDGGDETVSQAQQDRRIDYVEFLATDIAAVKEFYSAVFGWQFTDYGPTYTSFTDGRLAGGFTVAPEVPAGGPLVVIYATNLEEVEASVRERGGQIVKEIFEFPGGRRFHFTDPSGNQLAVWSE